MRPIIECVPNFSEGRHQVTIDALAKAVSQTPGATLLNVEPDGDYNRCVVTFVGDPGAVVQAAFAATRIASEAIDMTRHKGGHPRLGATDVVPFIPVSGTSMADAIACARQYGERVGRELDIPVYLYEKAATRPERGNLAQVRKGEYEGLERKLQDPLWQPDFGPRHFNAKSGATITGARQFLIAYNVNLATDDLAIANTIAGALRESGCVRRDAQGRKMVDENGKTLRIPGKLKHVKALGVAMPDHGIVQVSMNLTDFHITPPHVAYEECCNLAKELGTQVTGSEVVGLIPEEALSLAGRYFSQKQTGSDQPSSQDLVAYGAEKLGLSDLYPFKLQEKVIEARLDSL